MSLNLRDIIGNIFYNDQKETADEKQRSANLQQTINNVFGTSENASITNQFNPFLNKSGNLVNRFMDYQKMLDNPNVSQKVKQYISQATGLTPTVTETTYQTLRSPIKLDKSKDTTPEIAEEVVDTQLPVSEETVENSVPLQESTETDANIIPPNTTNTEEAVNTAPTNEAEKKTTNAIADAAQKYIGTPYVWGGESMAEGGMDCSGFVYNALKDAGYNVGRTTAQGYRNNGTKVSKANMQPGDLVFFGKNGNASHIGIYIGNGKMIHSSGGSKNTKSNPGKGVTIANVDYRKDFLEAKRY